MVFLLMNFLPDKVVCQHDVNAIYRLSVFQILKNLSVADKLSIDLKASRLQSSTLNFIHEIA